jgi:hypothetical protein
MMIAIWFSSVPWLSSFDAAAAARADSMLTKR